MRASGGFIPAFTAKARLAQNGGYGNLIVISAANGLNDVYGHMTQIFVANGDLVVRGELIGTTGRTGNANNPDQPSEDDHLHYGRFKGAYEKNGSLKGRPFIDPQESLNNPCP